MSGRKQRGPESSFDLKPAGAGVSEPQPRKPTAEDMAAGAENIADNLDRHYKGVSKNVAAMEIAAIAENRAGWTTAKAAADAGVTQIQKRPRRRLTR